MQFVNIFTALIYCILLSVGNAFADAFDDCVDSKIAAFKKVEDFTREGKVRCEGAGISGHGDTKNDTVLFSAAPSYQIIGNVAIDDLSRNRGNYGQAVYEKNDTGKVIKVTVPISCSSPSQLFGPGAWMKIRIRGKVEIPPTEQDLKIIFRSCANKL